MEGRDRRVERMDEPCVNGVSYLLERTCRRELTTRPVEPTTAVEAIAVD